MKQIATIDIVAFLAFAFSAVLVVHLEFMSIPTGDYFTESLLIPVGWLPYLFCIVWIFCMAVQRHGLNMLKAGVLAAVLALPSTYETTMGTIAQFISQLTPRSLYVTTDPEKVTAVQLHFVQVTEGLLQLLGAALIGVACAALVSRGVRPAFAALAGTLGGALGLLALCLAGPSLRPLLHLP